MNAVDLIVAQTELECIGLNPEGLLCRIPGENPDDIHRLFIAKHNMGFSIFIREDVDSSVIDQLKTIEPSDLYDDADLVSEVLYGTRTGNVPAWSGSAFRFFKPFPVNYGTLVKHKGDRFVIEVNGQEVSWAWSSRRNSRCAELAVETVESHRRNGYARMVAAAWANHQLNNGLIPFYSHKSKNTASRGLAMKLGIIHFMDCISYE